MVGKFFWSEKNFGRKKVKSEKKFGLKKKSERAEPIPGKVLA